MFQERTKKLFALKKSEKNNQKHIQSLSKDLISEENFNKFKSQKSYHTNTESQTHQKAQSTVINGPNDNNIISINLNILPKEKKNSQMNKTHMTDNKLTSSKKIFKTALSPNYQMNSQILKKKTNYNNNKTKEKNKNKINIGINENINESINNNKMNYSMNSSINKRNLNNNKILENNNTSKISGIKKILNDQSIQEIDMEENAIINLSEKNKNNISNTSNSNENNNKNIIKSKPSNNINNINVNINYNNSSNSPKNKKGTKINENSFSINNINTNDSNDVNENNKNLNIELLIYSKKGYKEKILEIISHKNVDINYQNENGWTALHYACDEGNLKIAEILIKDHCNVNIKNNDKKTPLHYSVMRGYFDITKLLIENGGDINCLDNENNNLIHICSMNGYDELLTFLLNKSSDLIFNKNIFGNTPLQLAKKKETKIIIEKYMKNNQRMSQRNKSKNAINNLNINSKNELINNNDNKYINSNDPISKIKIHKTNQNQIKALMIPINKFNHKIGANLININDRNDKIKSTSKTKFENIIKINNSTNTKFTNKQNFSPSPSGSKNISISNSKYKNAINSTKNINLFHYNTSSKNPNKNKKQFNIQPNNIYKSPLKTKKSKDTLNNNKKLLNTNYLGKRLNTIIKIEKNKLNNKNMSNSNNKILKNKSKSKYEINKRNIINNIANFKNNINNVNINHSQSTNFNTNNFQKTKSKTNNNNYLDEKQKKNSKYINKNSKQNIDINDNSISKNIKNQNMQNDSRQCMPSHRTISLPGFIDNNSNKNILNANNQSRNHENKKNKSNLKNNKNSVLNKKKELTTKTKSDLNKENNSKTNFDKHNFNKNLSEFKIVNDNKNKSTNNFRNDNNAEKNKILIEKGTSHIGQIYTDEEENNLIEDLDEEIHYSNHDNMLINDNENNDYEYGDTMIIKDDKEIEDDFKHQINSIDINKSNRQSHKNENHHKNNLVSYKTQINNTDSDDIHNFDINEFNLKDKNINQNQNTNSNTNDKTHKENNNNTQTNDIDNENDYFNNIDEMSDSNYSSEEENNNQNEVKKIGPSNFICLALLGQGSFGEVYLVQEKNTQNYFAMKVLDKKRIAKQNIFKYAMTERNVLSIINFPFIVKLNYAFQTKEKLFLLLDYCPGGDLSKQLQIQTRFSEDKAKFYICEITLALGELHKKDIIFRDLKPDNIVIDREGHAMLTDFGLSREGVNEKHIAKSFCGSIAYLAPEMLNRKGHGKAVDWYLLGVCFYEMLVGIPPYFSNNKDQIFKNIEKAELFIPNFVSKKAEIFLRDLLKKDPEHRLGSKRDVEEIKEHPYMEGVDWDKVYKREYIPPPIIQKYNNLNFFDQPKIFIDRNEINNGKNQDNFNQILFNNDQGNDPYEGWSFVQNANNNDKKNKNK